MLYVALHQNRAKLAQIQGVLLEEVVLYLLQRSGYRTVEEMGNDPTLGTCAAGLEVIGRGEHHQIDAIADFLLSPPFSSPQRLLVEAKCYNAVHSIGLPLVRNAVGVLKDVSEYWVPSSTTGIVKKRYHYQYALFATSHFTVHAQRYAFAHDIHLFPLNRSTFLRPVVQAIHTTAFALAEISLGGRIDLREVRRTLRSALDPYRFRQQDIDRHYLQVFSDLTIQARRIDGALLAMVNGTIPIFLVPEQSVQIADLQRDELVRITWDREGWYIVSARTGNRLFSFDLPSEVLNLYAEAGILTRNRALDLKEDVFSELQAMAILDGHPHVLRLQLDQNWLQAARARV